MPLDEFSIALESGVWTGWTEIEISRSIERMGAAARIIGTVRPDAPFLNGTLKPGAFGIARIGARSVLSGFVDAIHQEFWPDQSRMSLSLRDRTGDLVDCAASIDGPFEFSNANLEQIVPKIAEPFGIAVRFLAPGGAPFSRLAIQPGETAYELIERACRMRAVLPLSDGLGGLVITKPGSSRAAGSIVYGQNALEGSASLDHTQRFSLYAVKGQAEALDESTAEETSGPEGRATDPLVTRYRPTLVMAENQGFDLSLQGRAEWEARFARARSSRARYVVQGWSTGGAGALWQPNTLVEVDDPLRGLRRDMLIVAVTFSGGARGTTTTLDLALPEAFDLPALREDTQDADPWGAT